MQNNYKQIMLHAYKLIWRLACLGRNFRPAVRANPSGIVAASYSSLEV
jgi:hypothetical protein